MVPHTLPMSFTRSGSSGQSFLALVPNPIRNCKNDPKGHRLPFGRLSWHRNPIIHDYADIDFRERERDRQTDRELDFSLFCLAQQLRTAIHCGQKWQESTAPSPADIRQPTSRTDTRSLYTHTVCQDDAYMIISTHILELLQTPGNYFCFANLLGPWHRIAQRWDDGYDGDSSDR